MGSASSCLIFLSGQKRGVVGIVDCGLSRFSLDSDEPENLYQWS